MTGRLPQPSWYLSGYHEWRTLAEQNTVASPSGLQLLADPAGPLALEAPDGSLGQLILPRGIAVTGESVYLLVAATVLRYDPRADRFERLDTVGGEGSAPRRFQDPGNIAVSGQLLYVADRGNRRVQVFDLKSLVLLEVFDLAGEPVDVAVGSAGVYVLDQGGRVYQVDPSRSMSRLVVRRPEQANHWVRLAVDQSDRVYLLDDRNRLEMFVLRPAGPTSAPAATFDDAESVRDRFPRPAITLNEAGRFRIPSAIMEFCPGPDQPRDPLVDVWFDRTGRRFEIQGSAIPGGIPTHRRTGFWISQPLDSGIFRCQWHRIRVRCPALPPGSAISIHTATGDDRPLPTESAGFVTAIPADPAWVEAGHLVAPAQPDEAELKRLQSIEILVHSEPGRFLQLLVGLESTGFNTPVIESLRVDFPRRSYLEYLPGLYSTQPEMRSFLDQLLSLLQSEWEKLERIAEGFDSWLDPETVPSGDAMHFLAAWIGIRLEGSWDDERNRRLLGAMGTILPRWGTPEGIRRLLAVYAAGKIQAETGDADDRQYPLLVEGFEQRRHLVLGESRASRLGGGGPLWSPAVTRRLQIGVFDQLGEVELRSTGAPSLDLFNRYAHRFQVFLPSAWVRTAEDEALIRRAIDMQKPAHTTYELVLVEPRFRVGIQSTVGFDTIVGGTPPWRLPCEDDAVPPGRSLEHRLGFDTTLGADPGTSPLAIRDLVLA